MSDLIISGVEAGYGHVRVLHGINLKVSDKPVALMGRNGMGKTTLAQAIMGINATTAGTITYGDVTLTGLTPTKILTSLLAVDANRPSSLTSVWWSLFGLSSLLLK